ncbi:hypothetical protein HDU76_003620, partial [Blyttiomyces sp. JEL0837]
YQLQHFTPITPLSLHTHNTNMSNNNNNNNQVLQLPTQLLNQHQHVFGADQDPASFMAAYSMVSTPTDHNLAWLSGTTSLPLDHSNANTTPTISTAPSFLPMHMIHTPPQQSYNQLYQQTQYHYDTTSFTTQLCPSTPTTATSEYDQSEMFSTGPMAISTSTLQLPDSHLLPDPVIDFNNFHGSSSSGTHQVLVADPKVISQAQEMLNSYLASNGNVSSSSSAFSFGSSYSASPSVEPQSPVDSSYSYYSSPVVSHGSVNMDMINNQSRKSSLAFSDSTMGSFDATTTSWSIDTSTTTTRSQSSIPTTPPSTPKQSKPSKHHNQNQPRPKRPTKEYKCDQCQTYFLRKQDLDRHRFRHGDIKAFQCPYCDTKFTRKDARQRHVKRNLCQVGVKAVRRRLKLLQGTVGGVNGVGEEVVDLGSGKRKGRRNGGGL